MKDDSRRFNTVHAVLVDTTSSTRLILWESFVNSVLAGRSDLFHNLTVCKDKFTDEIHLNIAQSGTEIKITPDFQQTLAVAPQAPKEYPTTTTTGEIISVETLTKYKSCCKCNKNIQGTISLIRECQTCHLKQKVASTAMQWHATVLFKKENNKDFHLAVFNIAVKEISSFKKEIAELTEDDITIFLSLPICDHSCMQQ